MNNVPLIDERKERNGVKGGETDEFCDDLMDRLVVDEKLNRQGSLSMLG